MANFAPFYSVLGKEEIHDILSSKSTGATVSGTDNDTDTTTNHTTSAIVVGTKDNTRVLGCGGIISPHTNDVLSGRGNMVHYHPGNEYVSFLLIVLQVVHYILP